MDIMKTLLTIILSLQLTLFPVAASAKVGSTAYVKALSSMALGATGSAALTSCNFAWSTTVFSASAIAMIAGDLILAKSYSDYQKKKRSELKLKEDELKDGNGDYQKEIVDQRLEMENQELKNIKKREVLHYAVGVALTAAVVLAIIENIQAYGVVPNPLYIANGGCNSEKTLEVLGISVSTAVQMAWGAAAAASGASSAAGGIFSILQMALTLATKAITKVMGKVMSTGVGRAIYFGANAALVYWVAADLSVRKKDVKENVKKLESLQAKIKSTETTEGSAAMAGTGDYNSSEKTDTEMNIKELAKGDNNKSCFSMANNTASFGSSACKNAVKISPINFKGGLNIPALQSVSGLAVSAANDLAAGNWAGAEVALADIGSKAGQIRDIAEEVQKKYNDNLKAQGKPTIDFKGEIAKQTAALEAEMNNAMGSSGSSLASAPQATISEDSKSEEVASTKSGAAAPAMPMDMAPAMDLTGIGGEDTSMVEDTSSSKSLDESLGDYEVAENDISKDPGVSIFKQVSNRYILNYRNFFSAAKKSLSPVENPEEKVAPAATP